MTSPSTNKFLALVNKLTFSEAAPLQPTAAPPVQIPVPQVTAQPAPKQVKFRVHVQRPQPQALGEITDLGTIKEGPRRLLELLHRLAIDTYNSKKMDCIPNQIAVFSVQELLAAELEVSRMTLHRWIAELKGLELIQARAHKGTTGFKGEKVSRNDGTLFAVPFKAHTRPRIRYDDLKMQYRDLDLDRSQKNTVWSVLQSITYTGVKDIYQRLKELALSIFSLKPSLIADCNTMQDFVYELGSVLNVHPTQRQKVVSELATTLATLLKDTKSHRWYCKIIWEAFLSEIEGTRGLGVLASQLQRLTIDRREWITLRNPAALLASRLR